MRRLAIITVAVCATLFCLFLIWVFRPVLWLFGGSLAISAALRPLVQRLEARGTGRGAAILAWYLVILAGLIVGVLIFGLGVASEITEAAGLVPRLYEETRNAWLNGGSDLQKTVARGLPNFADLLRDPATGAGLTLLGGTLAGITGGLIGNLVFLIAVLCLAYYWLMEVTHFERLWLSLLPVGARVRAREIWRNAEAAVGAYIRATVVAVSLAALLLLALYEMVSLPFAATMALLGGLGHIVPRLGPAVALLIALLAAAMISPLEMLLVLIGGGAILFGTHKFAVRSMQNEALKVNPLLQVLVLLALADLGGLWLMIFAPPLAALIQVLYASLLASATDRRQQESAFDLLIERLERLQGLADEENLELKSTLRRSNELIQQAQMLLDNGNGKEMKRHAR
jgi:predicted PurR-regulated permease PerM